jgi:uncharacterized protein YbjT (DUF2867 family)
MEEKRMTTGHGRIILVTGATGLQGSAVVRHLLDGGWRVRALTRNPNGEKARALAALGAEVVQGDMGEPASLTPLFAGVYGVFSVQNPYTSGVEGEIRQGKNVADAARQAGAQHLVYSSTGTGVRGSGIPSWESKLAIEEYMKSLALPLTILRPRAFMEIMTEKKFFPAASAWHLMPRLMGGSTRLGWLSVDDLAVIAGKAFADPERFAGKELPLAGDVKSLDECRAIYRQVMGKKPPRGPMPIWLFERFGIAGQDLTTMWRWLRTGSIDFSTDITRAIYPTAMTVQSWLEKQKSPSKPLSPSPS